MSWENNFTDQLQSFESQPWPFTDFPPLPPLPPLPPPPSYTIKQEQETQVLDNEFHEESRKKQLERDQLIHTSNSESHNKNQKLPMPSSTMQYKTPIIIYDAPKEIIRVRKEDFLEIVQLLTGMQPSPSQPLELSNQPSNSYSMLPFTPDMHENEPMNLSNWPLDSNHDGMIPEDVGPYDSFCPNDPLIEEETMLGHSISLEDLATFPTIYKP